MKTFFGMMLLLAATNAVACVGAPVDDEDSTEPTTKAQAAELGTEPRETAEPKVEQADSEKGPETIKPNTIGSCTPAELANCRRQDPYGSGCEIYNGKVICLFE